MVLTPAQQKFINFITRKNTEPLMVPVQPKAPSTKVTYVPVSQPSTPKPSSSGGSSGGGGSTQTTQSSNIPFVTPTERLIAQVTGQPSENMEKAKTEIALLKTQESAPKVMTPQGAREWAIRKEVYAGKLPIGYGGVYSERKYTPQQLVQRSYDIYQQTVKNRSDIENVVGSIEGGQEYVPPEWFPHTPDTVSVTGYRLKEYLKENYVNPSLVSENQANKFYQESLTGVKEWHPDTKITENPTGFKFEFPYAGAEYYGSYKKMLNEHPELPALRAVTSPYLNVDLALADQKEREKIMIQYLHEMKGSPTGGPDLMRGISTVAGSPFVTISTSALGGIGIGKAAAFTTAKFAARPIILGGLKLGIGAAGVGFAALAVKDVYDVSIEKGIGAGIGKGFTTGLSFGAAGVGFKMVKPKIPEGITWGYRTEKVGSVSEIKGIQIKGVPSEKMRLELSELTAFKKTGKPELNIYFPGEKPSPSYGFMVKKASPQLVESETGLSTKLMSKMESISFKKIQSTPKDIMAYGQRIKGVVVGRKLSFFKEEPGKPLGGITKTIQKEIPGKIFRTEVESPVIGYNIAPRFMLFSTSVFTGNEKLRNPVIEIRQIQEKRVVPSMKQISEQAVNKKLGIDRVSVPAKASESAKIVIQSQDKARVQIMDLAKVSKQKTKQISEMNRTTIQEGYLYPYLPVPHMFGRGSRGWDYKLRQQEYKFRKASIKLPFSMAPRKVRF